MPRVGLCEMLAIGRVVAGGKLLRYGAGNGGFTARFEKALQSKIGVNHALTVNSGTSALIAALVGAGVGPGDEVLVPAYTWVATAAAPLAVGAVPVLVDVDESLTIDPKDIERKITPFTKAIIPVHMMNVVCAMDAIMEIARRHGLTVIEDACQGVGVSYKGRRVGSIGDAGAFSFNQYKNLNSGEGGAVVTNDSRIFMRARMYHDVGSYVRGHEFEGNEPVFAGVNFRVSEITGAILHAQLPRLDRVLGRLKARRKAFAETLSKSRSLKLSPHNDPDGAVGLSVIFDEPEAAAAFAKQRGVQRLIDSGRHVYTNWEPILMQRVFDDRMNPYRWARRKIEYSPDMCQRTLDILKRTCAVTLGAQYPLALMRMQAKSLLAAAS
jgi:dTDP-4-amino-4,6-dideoxygalactose transaminase